MTTSLQTPIVQCIRQRTKKPGALCSKHGGGSCSDCGSTLTVRVFSLSANAYLIEIYRHIYTYI